MNNNNNFEPFIKAVKNNNLNLTKQYYCQDFLYKLDENDFNGFHHACNLGYLEIAKYFIDQNVNLEFVCPYNKWRALHWAVGNGYEQVGELLIKHGADKETKTSKGLSPLHCAAIANHVDAVKMLLVNGADVNARNDKNETAMQMAQNNECDECAQLFKRWIEYYKIFKWTREKNTVAFKDAFIKERIQVKEEGTNLTVMDVAVQTMSYDCLEYMFLENLNETIVIEALAATIVRLNIPEQEFTSQFRLYRSILFETKDEFEANATVWNVNIPWILTGQSFLEFCAQYNRAIFVTPILQMTLVMNDSWRKSIDVAVARGHDSISTMIENRRQHVENRYKASYNRLHVAVQDNQVELIKYILDKELIDPNVGDPILGTPLCLAFLLGHGHAAQVLCQHNVDVNKATKFNQTPLHIAIESKMTADSINLINASDEIDHKDCYGFTPLHCAVINNEEELCGRLIERGANILMPVQIRKEDHMDRIFKLAITPLCLHENPITLSLKLHRRIMAPMLARVDQEICNLIDEDGNSLLHISSKLLVPAFSTILLARGSDVNVVNQNGNTALHSAFLESTTNSWEMEGFIETIEILIRYGASVNLVNNNGISAFKCALGTNSKNTLNVILNQCDRVLVGVEDILLLYQRQWADSLKTVLDLQDLQFKRRLIMTYITESQVELIDFILELSSEEFVSSIVGESLGLSARLERDEIFEIFLRFKINNPQLLEGGETILTNLILNSDEKYSNRLCKSENAEALLDMKNARSQTALHVAASRGYLKLFKHLLLECQNSAEECDGMTPPETLMECNSNTNDKKIIAKLETILKSMIKQGLDIYESRNSGPTLISRCKNAGLKARLENYFSKPRCNLVSHQAEKIDEDKNLCEICLSDTINCQFGCGHPFCKSCASKVTVCPKCRKPVSKMLNLYL